MVANMTGTVGRKRRFSTFIVVGNGNGIAGEIPHSDIIDDNPCMNIFQCNCAYGLLFAGRFWLWQIKKHEWLPQSRKYSPRLYSWD